MISKSIKFLYVNGCSWSSYHGISSDINFPACEKKDEQALARTFSWPNLVASHLGAELRNDSTGGGSNTRIVRTTCDFIRGFPSERYSDLLVVIGWTAPERDEIYVEYNDCQTWHLFNPSSPFYAQFSDPNGPYPPHVMESLEEYHGIYTRLIQNDKADLIRFFNQIFLMSNMLENLNIRYLFFSSIGFPQMRKDPGVLDFFEKDFRMLSKPRFLGMDRKSSMLDFCHGNAVQISPCLHPMIEGHKLWGEHLLNTINDTFLND